MREPKRRLWHETRWDGLPGIGNALRRLLYQFEGAAQLGDPKEAPYVPPANPVCPICKVPMSEHRMDRGGPGKPTYFKCPPAGQAATADSGSQEVSGPDSGVDTASESAAPKE